MHNRCSKTTLRLVDKMCWLTGIIVRNKGKILQSVSLKQCGTSDCLSMLQAKQSLSFIFLNIVWISSACWRSFYLGSGAVTKLAASRDTLSLFRILRAIFIFKKVHCALLEWKIGK